MLVGSLLDTAMNLVAIAFIGALVWLMLRPLAMPDERDGKGDDSNE